MDRLRQTSPGGLSTLLSIAATWPAVLELHKGSARQAVTITQLTERNPHEFYI